MKYDWKFKLDCVRKYKEGRRDFAPPGIGRGSFLKHVGFWVRSYDDLGIDNCIMESFFGTLKNEMFYGHESEFKTFDDLYAAIKEYIDYYNNERIKGKTKWMPPRKFREASMLGL